MSTTETINTLITALQSGDLELAAGTMTNDFTVSGLAPTQMGKDKFLAVQSALLAAMPDFSYNLTDVLEEGDRATALINITGTHNNELSLPMFGMQSIPATGLAVALPQVGATFHFKGDQVAGIDIQSVPGGGLSGLTQQVGAELPLLPRERDVSERDLTG